MKNNITFEEWIKRYNRACKKDTGIKDYIGKMCDQEVVREYYNDGYSPEESWKEEYSYWED